MIAAFKTPLVMELVLGADNLPLFNRRGRQLFILTSDLIYDSEIANITIVAKAGFITDLESCPRVPFAFFLVGDTIEMPAVIHDNIYTFHQTSREMADEILREAALLQGYSHWKVEAIYEAVSNFGEDAWQPGS